MKKHMVKYWPAAALVRAIFLGLVLWACGSTMGWAGERLLLQLKDFTAEEVKGRGFTLRAEAKVHIRAVGAGGTNKHGGEGGRMFAYGWIIDSRTRNTVWLMTRENTNVKKPDRIFDGTINLPAGSYEAYFTAYGYSSTSPFTSFTVNVDRRRDSPEQRKEEWGFFTWLEDFFGEDFSKEWDRGIKKWGMDIFVDERVNDVATFSPPSEVDGLLYQSVGLGENEHVKQAFSLTGPSMIRIYAIGEADRDHEFADYGWILQASTRHRVWEMKRSNTRSGGGAAKNVVCNESVTLPPGEYVLHYITDDSHSSEDWNSAPPIDPLNYGITLIATDPAMKSSFALSTLKEDRNIIAQLIRVGDDEMKSSTFTLKADARVHVYSIGERYPTSREMADFGWILNARTREKVWAMEVNNTEHAGGGSKNRMSDDVITLSKGTYTVYYKTDGSHSYNDWNDAPPYDPEHWGITLSGDDEQFDMTMVQKNVAETETGVLARIVRVGDDADHVKTFRLHERTKIRIYAIGEGSNGDMFDYGWIESDGGDVLWQMNYSMTFHAGGGRKNRLVNTTLTLEKGSYKLRYTSDDSHSFEDWNTDPPEDPMMWGITVYKE